MLGIFASAGNSKRSGESENARVVQFEILENLGNVPEPPFLHYSFEVRSEKSAEKKFAAGHMSDRLSVEPLAGPNN